ncbi:MAG: hypothetical protein Q8904_07750 [Bacteroidota bacterium]|nr:hypothetical protein [Bacteroidota bacterium]
MKTKVAGLLVAFSLITTLCAAQNKITVEAQNSDISNNLDLKAVATVFGESRDLEEFEKKLNDYDSQISNLDLNNDGQVDYLRVIEKTEKGVHVVEIQAVLAKDVYQDVASIVVEKDQNDNTTVQVVGDPYLYGDNYVIEPAYVYTPSIFSFFWGPRYYSWHSPYYWGYYPTYYHHHSPFELNIYLSNVYGHVNHSQRYYYTNRVRNEVAARIITSNRRNDLGIHQPERSFSNRNVNVRNKRDFEFNRRGENVQVRPSYQGSPDDRRPVRTFDNSGNRVQGFQNGSRTTNYNGNVRTNFENRNSTERSYTTPANVQNSGINRGQDRNYQTRQAPAVSQPSRENAPRQQVQRNTTVSTPRPAPAPRAEPRAEPRKESRSSDSNRR